MPTCSGRCLSSEWRYRAAASMSVRRSRAGRRLAAGVRVGIARWRRAGTEPTRSPCNTPAPRTGHRLSESGHDRVEYEGLQAVSRTTRRQHDVKLNFRPSRTGQVAPIRRRCTRRLRDEVLDQRVHLPRTRCRSPAILHRARRCASPACDIRVL